MGLAGGFFKFVWSVPYADKFGHFFLMGILALLVNLAISASEYRFYSVNILKGSLFIVIIVTLEEMSQMFMKNRTFSVSDLLCDYAGIFCFGMAARYITRRKNTAMLTAREK